MARHKRILAPEKDEPALDISSLIDVCFLLLIYFLVTTQIFKKEQELSPNIPSLQLRHSPAETAALHIIVGAEGSVSLKDEASTLELIETDLKTHHLPTLSKRLRIHKTIADIAGQTTLVQLQVNQGTAHQRVVDVLNALADAKITEITFTDIPTT